MNERRAGRPCAQINIPTRSMHTRHLNPSIPFPYLPRDRPRDKRAQRRPEQIDAVGREEAGVAEAEGEVLFFGGGEWVCLYICVGVERWGLWKIERPAGGPNYDCLAVAYCIIDLLFTVTDYDCLGVAYYII